MDIGAEISKKIQMAITAKLKELDAYVDDELPDYIMIMVANKKTESQMTEALSLFLSKNTTTFTSWLHSLLANLRKAKTDRKEQGSENLITDDQEKIVSDNKGPSSAINRSETVSVSPKLIRDIPTNKIQETEKQNTINVKSKTNKLKTVLTEEPTPAEAIITINAESDDVLDEELRSDATAMTFVKPVNERTEALLPRIDEIQPTTSVSKMVTSETKSNTGRENIKSTYKRKHDNTSRKSLSSSSSKSKTSKETHSDVRSKTTSSNEKGVKKSRRESESKHSSNRSGPSSRKNSDQTIVREWDRGKGQNLNGDTFPDRVKKHPKDRYEEWVELTDEEENYSKLRGSVYSTVNTVDQAPEFISDDSSDDNDTKLSAITSKISYPERKMRVPLGKQANKALLIRAVSEAEKSVRRKRSMIADEERKEPGLHAEKKRERWSRDPVRSGKEHVQKPIKLIRRRSGRTDPDGRKFIIQRVKDQVPYQEGRETKKKKVTIVEKHKKQTEPKDEVSISSPTSNVILLERGSEDRPVTVIFKRKNRGKQKDVIYVEGSTSEDEPNVCILTKDKRNFMPRDRSPKIKKEPKSSSSPVIKFDSRQTQHNSDSSQEKPIALKKRKATAKVPPRPHRTQISNQESVTKSRVSQEQSPKFIVTLDGVASTKTKIELNKVKTSELVSKDFKFEPVVPPSTIKSTPALEKAVSVPVQKPVVIEATDTSEDDHNDASIPASNTAIGKMREKLLKIQEEAAKLKRMQAKLAAAQAHHSALLKSGGMYADEVETEQKSIYIGNVNYSTTVKQLSDYFSICGSVSRVTILKDAYTGHPKGFAYLEFDDKRAVSSALALDNTRLNNRVIRVTLKSNPPGNTTLSSQPLVTRGRYPHSNKFLGRSRFSYSAFRYPSQSMKLPSKNKTWVNPSLNISKK